MKEFNVLIDKNNPTLGNMLDILARNGVNIKSVSTERRNGDILVKLITEDEETTAELFRKFNIDFEDYEIIPLTLIDRPGELVKIIKILERNDIKVESLYVLGKNPEKSETEVALRVADPEKVRELLK